jgi:hypothetical protein
VPPNTAHRVLLGLLLVGTGLAILTGRLAGSDGGAVTARIWELWPLVLIVAGLIRVLWFARRPWELIRPAAVILGASLLLAAHGAIAWQPSLAGAHYSFLLWPAAVILAGCWILLSAPGRTRRTPSPMVLDVLVWLRGDHLPASDVSGHGRVRVVLGYLRLDLNQLAEGGDNMTLDVTVVLGHVRILVPGPIELDRHPAFVLSSHGLRYTSPPGERSTAPGSSST